MRFGSSYFPFTELSMDVDILCSRKGGEVPFGEGDNRLEIVGCCGRFCTAGVRWLPLGMPSFDWRAEWVMQKP